MFAENLKFLREKYNIDQQELAEKLGRKSSSSISEWEKGKYTPKLKTLNE
ncbi:TPA: helix-turn-helix transcriptional regulator, partial [Enterococcus faecium]|nr:helix-turn-helix transcriptional regulator [Enterococcus faecium]HDG0827477.1 helix-turn-helix transcriptional regulator [Enterococcus faecium]